MLKIVLIAFASILLFGCDKASSSVTATSTTEAASNGSSSALDPALVGRWIAASPWSTPAGAMDTAFFSASRIQCPGFSGQGSFTASNGHIGYNGTYTVDYAANADTLWMETVLSTQSDATIYKATARVFIRRTNDSLHVDSVSVSDLNELRLGKQFDAELRANTTEYPLYTSDTTVYVYVQNVFDKVSATIPASEKPSYPFQKVLMIDNDSVVKAFAVPGGYIYVYTGLIKALKNENELAAVLAHEITHVTHHHYRNQLAKQYGVQTLASLLTGTNSQVAQVAAGLAGLSFSRDDEYDADNSGTSLIGTAGYNPLGVATFFERQGTGSTITILSTHPNNADRVAKVEAQVNASATLKALAYGSDGNPRTDDLQLVGTFSTLKAKFP
jgi:beta-barrel assembly-enhancing protease